MEELRIPIDNPIRLHCDNKIVVNIAHSPVHNHDKTKHVKIGRYFIKENIDNESICMTSSD